MRAQAEAPPAVARLATMHFQVPATVAGLAEDTMLALRRGSEARGSAFERMLAVVLLEWTSAPRHRDPVFERDGWCCTVPACGSRRNLHDHHIRFRSRGGDNSQDNRITICAAHHLNSLHMGRIRASGTAPSAIVWELGCRQTGGEPLARLVGDRYVMRA
ncbi:MAG: HNH endonuclease [Candidatus Binatia bacterium]